MTATGLRFSPALERLTQRARALLKNARLFHDPMFADADAVSSWVAAIGVEFDALYQELESVRRELRRDRDHTPDIPIAVEVTTPGEPAR